MSTLVFKDDYIEGVSLGERTNYPDLSINKDLHSERQFEGIDEKLYVGYGNVDNILPYKIRESYDRNIKSIRAVYKIEQFKRKPVCVGMHFFL